MPALADEVVKSPGKPLDASTRSFMEPRFGWDFGRVRVHTDGRAGESALAFGARAYTLGESIVFARDAYRPHSAAGRALLAHELTHVVQQAGRPTSVQRAPVIGGAGSPAEREAKRVAGMIERPMQVGPIVADADLVNRRNGAPKNSSDAEVDSDAKPLTPICGPDVTEQVKAAVTKTKSKFAGLDDTERNEACDALDSYRWGAIAWDVVELKSNAWILNYRPECATEGMTPHCGSSVQVGKHCYYAGSANYVIFGTMCKLCNSFFTEKGEADDAARFSRAKMLLWIARYKGEGFTGLSTPSGNYETSKAWAFAGYGLWPNATAPAGDREACQPQCPRPFEGADFSVGWHPHGTF